MTCPSSRVRLLGLLVFPLLLLTRASLEAEPRGFDRMAMEDKENILDVSSPKGRELLQAQAVSSCTTGSPLANTFAGVASITQVSDGASLNRALRSLNKPTIINLAATGTYKLKQMYGIRYNLCIQVSNPMYGIYGQIGDRIDR